MHYYSLFKEAIPAEMTIHTYLVNDGSKSGIRQEDIQLLEREIGGFTYIDSEVNQGKGGALRDAVRQTTGKWVIYTDADYPYIMANAVEMFR
ncbi:MAG: glycosyltransferase, partial [Aquirufa sp.]